MFLYGVAPPSSVFTSTATRLDDPPLVSIFLAVDRVAAVVTLGRPWS